MTWRTHPSRDTRWIMAAAAPLWSVGFFVLVAWQARANPLTESFESGFGGWIPQALLVVPDPMWEWSVVRSNLEASQGTWSLQMSASGVHDDGTVWVERSLALPAGQWELGLQFDLWSPADADIGTWQKVAFIGTSAPKTESSFTIVGLQDRAGWRTYEHAAVVTLAEPGDVWFAFGLNIVFETTHTHYFDTAVIQWSMPRPVQRTSWGEIRALYR